MEIIIVMSVLAVLYASGAAAAWYLGGGEEATGPLPQELHIPENIAATVKR